MSVSVKVEGLDNLRKVIRRVADKDLVDALKSANKSAAQLVVDRAVPNVPVRTGRLRASVRALGSQRSGQAAAGSARAPHAATIHWGRKRGNVGSPPGNHPGPNAVAARPFLADAAEKANEQIVREYETAVNQLMDAIGGRL